MKLNRLLLENYRCFDHLELPLHPQMTVLVAENGQGKSTLLDALRVALWPYVHCFDLASSGFADPANGIGVDDVRLVKNAAGDMARQLPCKVSLSGDYGNGLGTWTRFRESEKKGTKTKGDEYIKHMEFFGSGLQASVRDGAANINLPMLGYYGTGRLWSHKKLTIEKAPKKNNDTYMRLFAYRDCLDPASSYKHFAEWFTWIFESYREGQIKQIENNLPADVVSGLSIKVIQQATDCFLKTITGWHGLEYSVTNEKSLILKHEQYGTMKVELLSDGIRNMLAMVGDIAYRCIKLNPHFGIEAAKKTTGVVLIDEVDMHLHPRWQQLVLSQLSEAFPSIQFVVTTHSPQVLSSVSSDCIRILSDNKLYAAPPGTEGAEASRLLKRILGVDVRPPESKATIELNEYLTLVGKDQWNSPRAMELRCLLDARYQGEEPALLNADLLIENRKWELGQ
ncbi:MAG: AAA family ATPase [Gallionella sp.]|nr:AAA family ATPase [Gallionella sp.]